MWHELDALMHFWGYVFLLLKSGLNVSRCNYIFKSNAFYMYIVAAQLIAHNIW